MQSKYWLTTYQISHGSFKKQTTEVSDNHPTVVLKMQQEKPSVVKDNGQVAILFAMPLTDDEYRYHAGS